MTFYLVTGGAGFIGSHIVSHLVEQGERACPEPGRRVRVFDNFSTGRRENLAALARQIELVEGDVRNYHLVRQAMEGIDFVLHQAALPSVPQSVLDPITTNEVNVAGTLHVLQAAREAGVKRLVYASSCALYGDDAELPKHEGMCPRPLSPYAISKLAGEQYCRAFWQLYGFQTVCLRYFNVFGPRQDPASQYSAVIPRFITTLLGGQALTIYGDGTQSRDFVYVGDVVQANVLACTAPDAPGGVFNIACGQRCSLLELVDHLAGLSGPSPRVQFAPPRPGDVPHSLADISLARRVLAYQPRVDLAEGLALTAQWYRGE